MILQHWLDKHSREDNDFRSDLLPVYFDESNKYQNNVDYYYKTQDPAIFASIVYYKDQDVIINALCKVIAKLKLYNVSDEAKNCLLAVSNIKSTSATLKMHQANLQSKLVIFDTRNKQLANIILSLVNLRRNKPRRLFPVFSIVKMIVAFIAATDSNTFIMNFLKKDISIDTFEAYLAE